ncbi:MAG: hypothetical protein DRJ50_05065 [Actinobacteria bacterium]|nr:MAG: hypothetical protein DRJ50_05065 [Actinomycetota bacterium]
MPANPLTDPNWASETTDTVVRLVDTVRDQTTTKVVYAARGLVFGLIAVILGLFALVIALVGMMRGLQALLELTMSWEQAVYTSYFIVGGVLCLVGVVMFKKRNAAAV